MDTLKSMGHSGDPYILDNEMGTMYYGNIMGGLIYTERWERSINISNTKGAPQGGHDAMETQWKYNWVPNAIDI